MHLSILSPPQTGAPVTASLLTFTYSWTECPSISPHKWGLVEKLPKHNRAGRKPQSGPLSWAPT